VYINPQITVQKSMQDNKKIKSINLWYKLLLVKLALYR
jgi:hypothetical protein